jgi:hypothetical protein
MARKFFDHEQFNSEFQFYGGDYAAASRLSSCLSCGWFRFG